MANPNWIKGHKFAGPGNPNPPKATRPKGTGSTEIREIARRWTPESIQTLADIMQDPGAPPAARVSAASELLDRAWGKAPQQLSIDVHAGITAFLASLGTAASGHAILEGQAEPVREPGLGSDAGTLAIGGPTGDSR